MAKINEDIKAERDKCTFNVLELTNLIDGGPDKTKERKERGKYLLVLSSSDFIVGNEL